MFIYTRMDSDDLTFYNVFKSCLRKARPHAIQNRIILFLCSYRCCCDTETRGVKRLLITLFEINCHF